jgi:hypothetical protein
MARLRTTPLPSRQALSPALAALQSGMPRPEAANYAFYTYGVQFTGLVASSSDTESIIIDNDADFDWHASTYVAAVAGTDYAEDSRLIPTITIDIQTQDTQRISSIPLPLGAWFGDGRLPLVLPAVRRLARRTVINITAANQGAATVNLWLALIGKKLYS